MSIFLEKWNRFSSTRQTEIYIRLPKIVLSSSSISFSLMFFNPKRRMKLVYKSSNSRIQMIAAIRKNSLQPRILYSQLEQKYHSQSDRWNSTNLIAFSCDAVSFCFPNLFGRGNLKICYYSSSSERTHCCPFYWLWRVASLSSKTVSAYALGRIFLFDRGC